MANQGGRLRRADSGHGESAAQADAAPRERTRTREDGTAVTERRVFYVERDEVAYGMKHPKLKVSTHGRMSLFGRRQTERDGPFDSWREAREYARDTGSAGARIAEVWEERRQKGAIRKAEGGLVELVADGAPADA
jgi:hypothetical protein